ncbi:Peptidoglycan deacetylase [Defluviimonas aquaemixtae]|uniref:Chitooligosaccharide deacetylase n=1 Tax=Albidovulum aquaemixtae TaxID=1542388 RepID=A0A2R8B1Y4_9RHOB|nr:polysaccharide deacetylase family protein [Defluviimonas aquaemixtae]SPH16608.1 Peptidoglycan deacetylase [Defluviimonas aquaemixtae]
MRRKLASLSLDLDNLWSYMKTHGDPGWETFPSYLDVVVPRVLTLLDALSLKITVFVVGKDAALEKNHAALRLIADAGHEIGNHSFHHEPWLHLYSADEVADEIEGAEHAIAAATGTLPTGFRGPGYSLSETVIRVLIERGYRYDCSTFPTFVGPLARAYYFFNARLDAAEKAMRKALFGGLRDGLRPLVPYHWVLGGGRLLEIPVTTMPIARFPMHFSYLHWIAGRSEPLAHAYFAAALRSCNLCGITPSLLLHPLDFMGRDDVERLAFFPGMDRTAEVKMARMGRWLATLSDRFDVVPIRDHAAALEGRSLPLRRPDFSAAPAARQARGRMGLDKR